MVTMAIMKYGRWTHSYFYLLSLWFWSIKSYFKVYYRYKRKDSKMKKSENFLWHIFLPYMLSLIAIYVILNTFFLFSFFTSYKENSERKIEIAVQYLLCTSFCFKHVIYIHWSQNQFKTIRIIGNLAAANLNCIWRKIIYYKLFPFSFPIQCPVPHQK